MSFPGMLARSSGNSPMAELLLLQFNSLLP